MNLAKGTRLGKYELIMRIGRGGMASVWLALEHAKHSDANRLVALKVMLPFLSGEREFVCMFLDEVRLVRAIRHKNVVDVYDAGEDQGVLWMAMEWIEGDSLHAVIAEANKRCAIPPEIAVRIIADAAAGLHAAHELCDENGKNQNLVHRDVSPHNLLIGTTGDVKLVDFGVAKAMNRMSERTRTGHIKGKFSYMSPEQILGGPVDRRADVFGLGIVLYELTTGRRLFRGKSDIHTLELITRGRIPPPSCIDPRFPESLEPIVMRALERDVDRRYPTAAALESDLRNLLNTERILVPRSGVAGLLKRVLGPSIEQRRRAARLALEQPEWRDRTTDLEFISQDPVFTPVDSVTSRPPSISDISSLSQIRRSAASDPSHVGVRGRGQRWLLLFLSMFLLMSTLGYSAYEGRLRAALFRRSTPSTAAAPPTVAEIRANKPLATKLPEPPPNSSIPLVRIEELKPEAVGDPHPKERAKQTGK